MKFFWGNLLTKLKIMYANITNLIAINNKSSKKVMNGIARHTPRFMDYCAEFARLLPGFVQWTRIC